MGGLLQITSLAFGNLLIPIAIFIFATGFFPYKPFLLGSAQYEEEISGAPPPPAPFNKLVFMVVDALRSDFVYSNSSSFTFTQSLISAGAALPFTAHAAAPTITMPRVKAITTGSIPSFLDVLLNFAESDTTSTLATQDTWLSQMRAKDELGMLMYGDDTWLKLFPDMFLRSDGTSSFFVSDFTEVDNNVTRHIATELKNEDWNTMIMHFLGLDHIGHKAGPKSPNMSPKQKEMDDIVRDIYEAMEKEEHLGSTLLVLVGDHGMNDAGNHGGSAPGETSPALVFISPKIQSISSGLSTPSEPPVDEFQYYTVIEQSDVAPTLAGLLGFPVPLNSLGVFIPDLLPFWTESEQTHLVSMNTWQILNVVNATFPGYIPEKKVITTAKEEEQSDSQMMPFHFKPLERYYHAPFDGKKAASRTELADLLTLCRDMQSMMTGAASNYDVNRLHVGIIVALAAEVFLLLSFILTRPSLQLQSTLFSALTLLYGIMMFASSYVEEEHHIWYWYGSLWIASLCILRFRSSASIDQSLMTGIFLLLVSQRVIRRWNQTGQKLAGEPDISKDFLLKHGQGLWICVLSTYISAAFQIRRRCMKGRGSYALSALSIALCLIAITFKLNFTIHDAPELLTGLPEYILRPIGKLGLLAQARSIHFMTAALIGYVLFGGQSGTQPEGSSVVESGEIDKYSTIHDILTMWLATQSRVSNIPLFSIFQLQLAAFRNMKLTLMETVLTSLIFQYLSFFAFGGSNAISSVDLSNAYNGVGGYNVIGVGLLTFASNWAAPIWWASATMLLLLPNGRRTLLTYLSALSFFVGSSLVFVMVACTLLRSHLFIWTVFSPKYLYSMAWSLAQHLFVNFGFSGLLLLSGVS